MKKNDLKHIDFFYGLTAFIISLILWFAVIPTQIKTRDAYFPDAAMMPRFAVFVTGLTSLCLMILRLREIKSLKSLLTPSHYEFRWKLLLRQLLFLVLMVAYILAIPVCGFIIASSVFILIMLFYFGSASVARNVVIAVVFSVAIYFLFSNIFRVSLPSGWLAI